MEFPCRLTQGVALGYHLSGFQPFDWRAGICFLANPKERAEHVMLVDLARNDIGRVCDFGSVQVRDLMIIERDSHVMHIVSSVEGKLSADKSIAT